MQTQTVQRINQLNTRFYTQVADSFSASRNHAWAGWHTLLEYLPQRAITVLDVGCGNGRFEDLLIAKHIPLISYTGWDMSQPLLDIARDKLYQGHVRSFRQVDVSKQNSGAAQPNSFDVIVLLALLHHIPSRALRLSLLQQMARRIKPGGLMAVSLWHYESDPRFKDKMVSWKKVPGVDPSKLEPGDYLLTWHNKVTSLRYVHVFDDQEIETYASIPGLRQVGEFWADGHTNRLNQYLIFAADTVE